MSLQEHLRNERIAKQRKLDEERRQALEKGKTGNALDDISADDLTPSATSALGSVRASVMGVIQEWRETAPEDLGEGESLADRLYALMVGLCDMDGNDDIGPDEQDMWDLSWNIAVEYLSDAGVAEGDIDDVLNGEADKAGPAATRVVDLLNGNAKDGGDADEINNFAFDEESTGSLFDAAYKKTTVVRHGKKVRINKRVSGTVHLSAAQKAGLKRAQRRSHSAKAVMGRMKSVRMRAKLGMGNK